MTRWVVQPHFDEGDDWPESTGTPDVIEADTPEAARAEFPVDELTSLAGLSVMTPEEWFARGGYPLEGLERASDEGER